MGGDRSLVRPQLESSLRAGAVGGEIHIASFGPEVSDIVGAAVWYGPGQASMSTCVSFTCANMESRPLAALTFREEQREVGSKIFFAKCSEELIKWWQDHVRELLCRSTYRFER